MPRIAINYNDVIMYKIVCNDTNITDIYIGHTTNFTKRKAAHKSLSNNSNLYVYQFIRDNGGWKNWNMIMIEKYPCSCKLDATKRERELLEELKATLNKQIPSQTAQEYYYKKIHNDIEFYEAEKKRIIKYQVRRYANDEEFRNKKKEYCKLKMRELYDKRRNENKLITSTN
jgi:hypothetical protein